MYIATLLHEQIDSTGYCYAYGCLSPDLFVHCGSSSVIVFQKLRTRALTSLCFNNFPEKNTCGRP